MTDTWWCEWALVGDRVESSVSVAAESGRFTAVETGVGPGAGSTRLAGLTLPGFANAHSHAFHRALRSRTQTGRGTFWTWRDTMYAAAGRLRPDTYHRLARAVFGEMVLAGFTAVGEFHYLHHAPDGTRYDDPNAMGDALLHAAADVGIRITLLDTLYLHGGLDAAGYRAPDGVQRRFSDGSADVWAQRVEARRVPDPAVAIAGAAIHSVRAVDPDSMGVVGAWAAAHGTPIHVHASEQRDEDAACRAHHGATAIGLLDGAGLLSERASVVHATHASDADIAALAASRATVVVCPTTERDLGDGIGPTRQLAAGVVPMALGSDSHAVIDPFEEARALELHQRLRSERRGVHQARELVQMATVDGHRSLGWDDAGSLAVGGRADLVTLSLDSVRTVGASPGAALESAVFAATAADVRHVVVDGRTVVRDGRHVTIDVVGELAGAIAGVMGS